MTTIKTKSFTLLELLVCIVILGMIASVIATPIKSAIRVNRYKTQLYELLSRMQLASSLSLSYRVPMSVALHQKGNTLFFQFQSDEPLKGVDRSEKKIEGISKLICDGKEVKTILFTSTPSGFWTPDPLIAFHSDQIDTLDLKYRSALQLSKEKKGKERHQFLSRKDIEWN